MDASPPVKPPRGVKPSKETSGLLMSVIRTLSASETNEQRELEKAKLEADHKKSDRRLDELVSKHDKDLTQAMQLFGSLSTTVTNARNKIRQVKENLNVCKKLLHCRRDELKELWAKGLEYKYMLQLLEEIEKMNEVPNRLVAYLSRKHYLHATKLLVEAVNLGKGTLENVDGLKELSEELEFKKQQLHTQLLGELKHHLYVKTAHDALAFQRQGSGRDASPFQRTSEVRLSNRQKTARRNLMEALQNNTEKNYMDFDIEEDTDLPDPEVNSSHFIAILVKCLALLDKLPLTVESIKVDMQAELQNIVQRTTRLISDQIASQATAEMKVQAKATCLQDLFQTIFEQFRHVALAHAVLLRHLNQASEKYSVNVKLYDMQEFWSKVQAVLQAILTDYLGIQNLASEDQSISSYSDSTDLSTYFSRRKPQSKKKSLLFKFDNSSAAISMNTMLKGNMFGNQPKTKLFVCKSNPNNIIKIFIPLMSFIEEIEQAMGLKQGAQCSLNLFVSNYVTDIFLSRHRSELSRQMESAIRSSDAWKATTNTAKDLRPLLVSTVHVEKAVEESRDLMKSLPLYSEKILQSVCVTLKDYKETCQAAYRGIVQPHPEDRRICSATWLKDDDISRFLKSLPNWLNLKTQQEQQARSERKRGLRREVTTEEESPEEVRLRNLREAEILAGNLGEGGINAQEIISDINSLKMLAQLQESMEWFSVRILQFASEFRQEPTLTPSPSQPTSAPPVSSATLQALTSIGQDFDELANTCLLLLHLEVRVQCFHYLLAQSNYNKDTPEPDPKVLELSRVLANVDEAMSSSLQTRKCKYIFEGLGHLISKILISSAQYLEHIDEGTIQKMCRNIFTLQQTLTNITMTRELTLDHARHYFELFYQSPEDILNGIVEKGPMFSELEYMNAFQLISRSQTGKEISAFNVHLDRLTDILGGEGVTV